MRCWEWSVGRKGEGGQRWPWTPKRGGAHLLLADARRDAFDDAAEPLCRRDDDEYGGDGEGGHVRWAVLAGGGRREELVGGPLGSVVPGAEGDGATRGVVEVAHPELGGGGVARDGGDHGEAVRKRGVRGSREGSEKSRRDPKEREALRRRVSAEGWRPRRGCGRHSSAAIGHL